MSTSSELCLSHHRRLTTHCSLSFHHSEHPKIWLPRTLRQTYICKVGDTVNLLIPFQVIMLAPRWVHAGPTLGPGQGFDLETDTKSLAGTGAVILAWNGGGHVTRSLRQNDPFIFTPEMEFGLCPM